MFEDESVLLFYGFCPAWLTFTTVTSSKAISSAFGEIRLRQANTSTSQMYVLIVFIEEKSYIYRRVSKRIFDKLVFIDPRANVATVVPA